MDSITHIVLGAVTGEVIAGKKIGKQAMLWGAIANSLPDIDVITDFWLHEPDSLIAHRGITHSFFFCILISIALSFIMLKLFASKPMSFWDWLMIFLPGMIFHISIDAMTTYGTGLFEPFSHQRISLNNIFVADPFFTISLLIASIALLILKKDSAKRMRWALFGIILSTTYLVYTFYNKFNADIKFTEAFQAKQIKTEQYFTTPTPLNNWLWYGLGRKDDSLYIGYHSVFDRREEIEIQSIPVNSQLLGIVSANDDINKLVYFSQGYFTVQKNNDTLIFSDARFGQITGWKNKNAPFVFNFNLTKGADNSMVIQQGRFEASGKKAFRKLFKRIFYYD